MTTGIDDADWLNEAVEDQHYQIEEVTKERDALRADYMRLAGAYAHIREAVEMGLRTFLDTPPRTEFQRGYLGCLVNAHCVGGWPETEALRACRLLLNIKQGT